MRLRKLNTLGFSHLIVIALVIVGIGVIGTYMIIRSSASAPCIKRTFGQGSRGMCVRVIQKAVGTKIDGKYGPQTAKKVKTLQKRVHISIDGLVGPHTWEYVCTNLDQQYSRQAGAYYKYAGCKARSPLGGS